MKVDTKKDAGNTSKKRKGAARRRSSHKLVAPSNAVWLITMVALGSGFLGARVFHILENLDQFAADPGGMLFASGGFTFYGGLIVATICVSWYVWSKGLSVKLFADSLAPGLMLAYGIGRLGCHLSGDGDWGIPSNAAARPDWIPVWLWSESYPNNILGNTEVIQNPVYPTPIYEFLMATVLFAILWSVRKHPYLAGWTFSLYLVFAGVERYLIEQIRVNETFPFFGQIFTQAEFISIILIVVGVIGLALLTRRREPDGIAAPENVAPTAT